MARLLEGLLKRVLGDSVSQFGASEDSQAREAKKQTESRVHEYIKILEDQKEVICKLKAANSSFDVIRKGYVDALESCIVKAKARIQELEAGAVWDNLVIAFFGETNAGKSTIVETFRILYEEKTRMSRLLRSPLGVDGEIVGDGQSDFTKDCTEYKLSINGLPFILIDVPGIEGNESEFELEIKKALNKAHYVFYIQGQNKQPDTGTAEKIKRYLNDWVKVYSVYNVREIASYYKSEERRKNLGSSKIASLIENTFHQILGDTYEGNLSIQAYLALCAKAKFSPKRENLKRGQEKLLTYFGDEQRIYRFSQFEQLVELVADKAKNFLPEIVEANKEKHKSLLLRMRYDIKATNAEYRESIARLEGLLKSFMSGIQSDFDTALRDVENRAQTRYDELFYQLYAIGAQAINDGHNKEYCDTQGARIQSEMSKRLEGDIQTIVKNLREGIDKRKRDLDQKVSEVRLKVSLGGVNVKLNMEPAFEKLDMTLGDLSGTMLTVVGAISTGMALANFWNPIGWIVGGGILLGGLFFGGRDKKAEAKTKLREQLDKAKESGRSSYNASIRKVTESLKEQRRMLLRDLTADRINLENLGGAIGKLSDALKSEYQKINISEYGKL